MGTGSGLGRAWDCCVTVWCVCALNCQSHKWCTGKCSWQRASQSELLYYCCVSSCVAAPKSLIPSLLPRAVSHRYSRRNFSVLGPDKWHMSLSIFSSFKHEDKQTNVCTEQKFYSMTSHRQWHNGCVEGSPCAMVSLVVVGRSCC